MDREQESTKHNCGHAFSRASGTVATVVIVVLIAGLHQTGFTQSSKGGAAKSEVNAAPFSLVGHWDAGPDCPLEIYQDDGKTIKANCDDGRTSHKLSGRYEGRNNRRITFTITRRDLKGCETNVDGYMEVLDENRIKAWQEGWDGCGVRTKPVQKILSRIG